MSEPIKAGPGPRDGSPDARSAAGLRVSTAERDSVAAKLHAHASAGRLTAGELSSRLTQVLAAVTRGDLDRLLSDLPVFKSTPAAFPKLRVSSAEREKVVTALKNYHLSGRLSREEYDERVEIALIAQTYEELSYVLNDLPRVTVPANVRPPIRSTVPARPVRTVKRKDNSGKGCIFLLIFLAVIGTIIGLAVARGSHTLTGPAPAVPSWVTPGGVTATDWTALEQDIDNIHAYVPSSPGDYDPNDCFQLSTDTVNAINDINDYNNSGEDKYGTPFASMSQSTLNALATGGNPMSQQGCQALYNNVLALMNTAAQWAPAQTPTTIPGLSS